MHAYYTNIVLNLFLHVRTGLCSMGVLYLYTNQELRQIKWLHVYGITHTTGVKQ